MLRQKPNLVFLSADSCSKIGLITANALAQYSHANLQDLYLNSCVELTDDDVELITKHCNQVLLDHLPLLESYSPEMPLDSFAALALKTVACRTRVPRPSPCIVPSSLFLV